MKLFKTSHLHVRYAALSWSLLGIERIQSRLLQPFCFTASWKLIFFGFGSLAGPAPCASGSVLAPRIAAFFEVGREFYELNEHLRLGKRQWRYGFALSAASMSW